MTKKLLKFIFLNKKNILNYMEGYYCNLFLFYFHSYYYQILEWKQIIIQILYF